MKMISVSCPGSCGELFQCVIGDRECLMSYTIDKRSYVRLCQDDNAMGIACLGHKMQQALRLLPEVRGVRLEHYLEFPVGKGCSSSTADMLCVLKALSLYQGQSLSAQFLTTLCASVEPTDSVGFANWTVLDPLSGQVIWQTDWQPNLYVYILEPVATLKTVGLIRMKDCAVYPSDLSAQLFTRFKEACRTKSLIKLGQLATDSALLNDKRLPKPYLSDIIALAQEFGALGVNIAHSGTVVGILLDETQVSRIADLEASIQTQSLASYYQNRTLCQIVYEGVVAK